MRLNLTEHDYRRLTGRLYELHEKRRPGQPTDASDGDRTDSRDAEPDGDSQDQDDDTDASADDDGGAKDAAGGGAAPGSAARGGADDDGEETPAEPAQGAPAGPGGPPKDDDDGAEKPLPPNKDGIFGGKNKRKSLPTTVMGASYERPASLIRRLVRG